MLHRSICVWGCETALEVITLCVVVFGGVTGEEVAMAFFFFTSTKAALRKEKNVSKKPD